VDSTTRTGAGRREADAADALRTVRRGSSAGRPLPVIEKRNCRADSDGFATNLDEQFVQPLRSLASKTIDLSAVILGIPLPGTISDRVAAAYRKHVFGLASLQDLPDKPRFVINSTNIQTGALWRFSKPYMADYTVGMVRNPDVETIAPAVEAVVVAHGLEFYDLELTGPHRSRNLRILVDRAGGVDLEAITGVSEALSRFLDGGGWIESGITLNPDNPAELDSHASALRRRMSPFAIRFSERLESFHI